MFDLPTLVIIEAPDVNAADIWVIEAGLVTPVKDVSSDLSATKPYISSVDNIKPDRGSLETGFLKFVKVKVSWVPLVISLFELTL